MTVSEAKQLLADVEAFCQEIRPIEELCYVEHRFNDRVIPLGRKYNLLGMPVPVAYGGRGIAKHGDLREGTGPHWPRREPGVRFLRSFRVTRRLANTRS